MLWFTVACARVTASFYHLGVSDLGLDKSEVKATSLVKLERFCWSISFAKYRNQEWAKIFFVVV